MKTYKAKINSLKEYTVTHKDFEQALQINKHLLQNNNYYGICPYCDSPVQLIGLSKKVNITAHARHTKNSIKNVANKTEQSNYCPLNTHKRDANPEDRFSIENIHSLEVKKRFIENYDVIAKIINYYSDIFYSYNKKIELFKRAYRGKIWLFPEISQSNIPWILLYTEEPQEITSRPIKKDSTLFHDLKKIGINFTESFMKNYFLIDFKDHSKLKNTVYKLTKHQRKFNKTNDYEETFHAMLTKSKIYDIPPTEGFYTYSDKKIVIDHQELENKINYYNQRNSRDNILLDEIKKFLLEQGENIQ
ncbi:MAG: hypothetical protein IIX47_00405 [Spirochaetaceae bacterium]|nr:hypothetical protein [Spirochaetaceae bacterium]